MTGLVVSLAPYERVLFGGALMQNGPKKTSLRVLDGTWVLRLSDAMHPDDARTPLGRCYYAAQMLLTGYAQAGRDLTALLDDAAEAFAGFAFACDIEAARRAADEGAWYRVMRKLKPLLPAEAAILCDLEQAGAASPPTDIALPPPEVLDALEREPLTKRKP